MTVRDDRVRGLVTRLATAISTVLADDEVTYPELLGALEFLNEVGTAGEMVLLADVLGISTAVERRQGAASAGTPGNVQGPFWRPGAPRYRTPADLVPADAAGERLVISGAVRDAGSGRPLPAAEVEVWQTDAAGHYDQEDPQLPPWYMRGVVVADDQGGFQLRVVRPRAYQVPTSGPVGRLLDAVGQHPWRPAHTHLKVRAAGCAELTTMLYFAGDPWLDDDTIGSVKPELVVAPWRGPDGDWQVTYDFALPTI